MGRRRIEPTEEWLLTGSILVQPFKRTALLRSSRGRLEEPELKTAGCQHTSSRSPGNAKPISLQWRYIRVSGIQAGCDRTWTRAAA